MQRAADLNYEITGDGDPVLLIHGSHVADALLPVAREPALQQRYRLVRYHRRGFAESAPHSGAFPIEQQGQDALRLAGALGLERFHVVGYSYGGLTAIELARAAPEAVGSLALVEPPLRTSADRPTISELFAPLGARYRQGDTAGAVDAFMNVIGGADWRSQLERAVPGAPEQVLRDAATFFEIEAPALEQWTFEPDLARTLSQPALFVAGDASGPLFERPRELFRSLVPQAEEVVLPGLDHLMPIVAPGAVARAVADFFARHPL